MNHQLKITGKTHKGLMRENNEDALTYDEALRFAILADGMGGYNAGEVASELTCSTIRTELINRLSKSASSPNLVHKTITDSIEIANSTILLTSKSDPCLNGMGTTVVMAYLNDNQVIIAHLGDSRAYLFRNNTLTQLTHDHSVLQEQIDAGLISPEMALRSPHKNLITRALGVPTPLEIAIDDHQALASDIFLLCSDGLSDMLTHDFIQNILEQANFSLEKKSQTLIDAANEHGGRDNVSVILIEILI